MTRSKIKDEAALGNLVELLRKKYMTASAVAEEMGCSKPIAYRRINRLMGFGYQMDTQEIREGDSGPTATAYKIIKFP